MGNVFTQNIGNKITPFINDIDNNENQCVICLNNEYLLNDLHPLWAEHEGIFAVNEHEECLRRISS